MKENKIRIFRWNFRGEEDQTGDKPCVGPAILCNLNGN
jgi:hypothetical protein